LKELLLFDSRIERKFLTSDAVYKYTCGDADCKFTCEVPHLWMVVRVRGLKDDQIGIILNIPGKQIENILPIVPGGRYSSRTWRNSRFHTIRRMLLCLYIYYNYGDIQSDVDQWRLAVGSQWRGTQNAAFQTRAMRERIIYQVSKPLHAYTLGCVMGKLLDLQKRFLFFGSPSKLENNEMKVSL